MKIVIKIIVSLLLFATNLQAQSDSLASYLAMAAKNNPTVLQKYAEYQAALEKVPQVGTFPDPELSIGAFLSPMEIISGKQYADIKLMQMFPWFGTLKAAKDEMSLMAKAKYASMEDAKAEVFYNVEHSWYQLYQIEQNIRIAKKNLDILHTVERLALVRFKSPVRGTYSTVPAPVPSSINTSGNANLNAMSGMGGRSGNSSSTQPATGDASMSTMSTASRGSGLTDVYRVQIEIAEQENDIASLKTSKRTATAQFNSYLNRASETPVFIPEELDISLFQIPQLTDSLFVANPMLSMLNYEKQSLNARKRKVSKMGYPMVGIGVDYSVIGKSEMSTSKMNGNDMIMPMLTVTLPIYRGKYKSMKKEVEFQQVANNQAYTATNNNLKTEYYQAMEALDNAQRRINLYDKQSNLSEQTLNLLLKSFSSALGNNLSDVLNVNRLLLNYRLKKEEAIVDYNSSVALIKRLLCNN